MLPCTHRITHSHHSSQFQQAEEEATYNQCSHKIFTLRLVSSPTVVARVATKTSSTSPCLVWKPNNRPVLQLLQNQGRKIASMTTTDKMAKVTEGTATMSFPADQESTVFYNPVQVQNRDLSILMIALYAERRAVRQAVKAKKKELYKQRAENLDEKLKEFEKSLDSVQLVENNKETNGIDILDALAASGLRSIRYWNEIPGVKHVTINDLEEAAIERAKDNLRNNNLEQVMLGSNVASGSGDGDVDRRPNGICVNHGDATHELYMSRRPKQTRNPTPIQQRQQPMWDVIDLDPYGSAAPFLDGAVQAVENGGLLCITCTDMAALGGSHPETAFGRYAALPIQSARYLQELALRILLHTIAVSAAKYGRTLRPILSVGMAFYVRVFVEIHDDKRGVSDLSLNIGHVYQSTQCSTFLTLPHGQMGGKKGNVYQSIRLGTPFTCPETGAPFKVGGPMWMGPLHDQDVIEVALERLEHTEASSPKMEHIATRTRLQGLLTSVSQEIDVPLYYTLPDLCKTLRCSCPPLREFMAGIYNAGYDVSGYHKEPSAIKTNAPSNVVWDVLKAWVEKNPPKKSPEEDSPAAKIISKSKSMDKEVDFTIPESLKNNNNNVSRFPMNPEKHWGPKRKASNKRKVDESDIAGNKQESPSDETGDEPSMKRTAAADVKEN